MIDDPIVEEVRRVREAYAAQFNYDVEAMFRDLMEKERTSGRVYVKYPPKQVEPVPPVSVAPILELESPQTR